MLKCVSKELEKVFTGKLHAATWRTGHRWSSWHAEARFEERSERSPGLGKHVNVSNASFFPI